MRIVCTGPCALVLGTLAATLCAAALVLPPGIAAATGSTRVENVGLQTPESVLHDAASDVYLVSNINGSPTAVDGNGFISRIDPSGRVLALKWIDGAKPGATLNAPKGMAVAGDVLYVSDINTVRMFDRSTGQPKGSIPIAGATFLNDVAGASDGTVYVSDSGLKPDFSPSGTDAIYRIDQAGKVTPAARGTELNHPNGIAVRPTGRLVVVTFSKPGELYAVDPAGKRENVRQMPSGQLDGVVVLPGGPLLISSWEASAVYRHGGARTRVVVSDVPSPADIGYDVKRRRVLIPLFTKNEVVIQPL
jgi:DNA-binding beta-propeller fold protein YncE